jgi:hypothetical protein
MLAFVALLGLALLVLNAFQGVLFAWALTLLVIYLLVGRLNARVRGMVLLAACLGAGIPWSGATGYDFRYPGASKPLPTFSLCSDFRHLRDPLVVLYQCFEVPLHFLAATSEDASTFIYFAGEGVETIRPFVVFAFWMNVALVVGIAGLFARYRAKARPGC